MFKDRRTYPRLKVMQSFKVLFGDAELSCFTTDISPIGAFFAARHSPPVGEQIAVDVRPTGVKIPPVHLKAEVVRVNPLGGGHQPGFAVRFVSAHSDAGGASIYHVLRRVLHVRDISPDDLPGSGVVVFHFPEIGAPLNLQSARVRRPVTTTGTGARMTGRPQRPIQDAMVPDRRGSRTRSPVPSDKRSSEARRRWPMPEEPSGVGAPAQRRHSSTAERHPSFGAQPGRSDHGKSTSSTTAPRASATPHREAVELDGITAQASAGAARVISAEPSNAFVGARPAATGADSGVFLPPGGAAPRRPSPPASPPPAPPRPASPPPGPPRPASLPPAPPPSSLATFDLEDRENSGFFDGARPETSRIIAPFSDQSAPESRRRSASSTWSVYEPGLQERTSARRTSDIVIQDDPFATGARKVAARFREQADQKRDERREQREREREQVRAKLARRDGRPRSGAFSVEGDGAERSMIFARSGQASTLGGPMLTGMSASPGLPENATVAVQRPVTYELDGRFVPGTMVSAAPLAVEIHSLDRVPQLDQKLVLNMPVRDGQRWRTIYLEGKLLGVPEQRDGGRSFVLHIERVREGEELSGAYTRFLATAHAEGA